MTPLNPYLIRSVYEWILDNSCTPHLLVDATHNEVSVPAEHVNDGQIILNVNPGAIEHLRMDNDSVGFECRFSGSPYQVFLPIGSILGVYARENGRGMMLEIEAQAETEAKNTESSAPVPAKKGGSHLKLVE
ncbi:MAG: ClpXP protease specificity-enhancing factor [Pseudomonadales bacterium]|nr:ClpXP protease specificity-enhancing factor [Pseudomonadales bacterium]